MLCFFNKAFPAGRTGDLYFPLASGNANHGFTGGTFKITIGLSPTDPGKELAEFFVFRIPSGSVPGENAINSQYQRNVCQERKNHQTGKAANKIQHNPKDTPKPCQRIHTVSAGHEMTNGLSHPLEHRITSKRIIHIICQPHSIRNGDRKLFTDYLRLVQLDQRNLRPI